MKKNLFALMAGFATALVAVNGVNAQNSVNPEKLEHQKNSTGMEKVIPPGRSYLDDMGAVNVHALKDFAKTYKNVTAESWDKIRNGFTAGFISNGVKNTIFYSTNGRWMGSLKDYGEDKLQFKIRDIVKRQYYDYSIMHVKEVETIDSNVIPTYFIYLEDKDNFKMVRISDGQMDVMKEFTKG